MQPLSLMQVEGQTDEELAFLLGHDSDPFCRWEAGQTLLRALLTKLYNAAKQQKVKMLLGFPRLCANPCWCHFHLHASHP